MKYFGCKCGIIFQTFLPFFENVFNRFFVLAILDLEIMSPQVTDLKEYLGEETLTNKSEMYFGA